MVVPSRALLAGIAEIDETEIPLRGKDDPITGGGGRSSKGKMLVAGAVEVADGAPGRIRLATIEDFSAASLHGFVAANLAQGATIKPMDGQPNLRKPALDLSVIVRIDIGEHHKCAFAERSSNCSAVPSGQAPTPE